MNILNELIVCNVEFSLHISIRVLNVTCTEDFLSEELVLPLYWDLINLLYSVNGTMIVTRVHYW